MEMASADDEIQILRESNTELVQKVQYWKMQAAQKENEKLDLMKELNEMRLKLAILRNNGNILASKLDTALQSASEQALAHLVRASGEIARTIDLAKTYIRERNEADTVSPRWSSIGETPRPERIHRVPPLMIGGQSIQPVVSLSRTLMNTSNPTSAARSPNQSSNVTERALPMHMLQDVYIPLTRIDAQELQSNNMETEEDTNIDEDRSDDIALDNSGEMRAIEESQHISDDDYNSSRRLDAVAEDMEPEDESETPPRQYIIQSGGNNILDNPLEGPSWLLDETRICRMTLTLSGRNSEPDSTTEMEEVTDSSRTNMQRRRLLRESAASVERDTYEFSPTVRRRKRTSSSPPRPTVATPTRNIDHYSPNLMSRRNSSTSDRVLKVLVTKMRLDSQSSPFATLPSSPAPAKRLAAEMEQMAAPSPHGATVAGVIVSEATENDSDAGGSGEPAYQLIRHRSDRRDSREARPSSELRNTSNTSESTDVTIMQEQDSRADRSRRRNASRGHGSRDRDSGSGADGNEGRTRRTRNRVVSYQEKPLNRKMRR